MGGRGFFLFCRGVPSAFYRLGCRNEAKGIVYGRHRGRFDIDEDCLPLGAALQVQMCSISSGNRVISLPFAVDRFAVDRRLNAVGETPPTSVLLTTLCAVRRICYQWLLLQIKRDAHCTDGEV
ncbi:hypothetical protein [Numidum massiliense]|uniref:hypothetical protein n=1 Tax=Numidum massiliense TaxID=1522315 RepID=UPI00164E50A4|nr:hypothetical protein [Numidum massiliense]